MWAATLMLNTHLRGSLIMFTKSIYLHFGEESVYAGDCVEEDVGRQIVPHFQTPENVSRAVTHAASDRRRLYNVRNGRHLSRRRLDRSSELGFEFDALVELSQERLHIKRLLLLLSSVRRRMTRRCRWRRRGSRSASCSCCFHHDHSSCRFRTLLWQRLRNVVSCDVTGWAE